MAMELVVQEFVPEEELSEEQIWIRDRVADEILKRWALKNGKVSCARIPLYWRRYLDVSMLEIRAEEFSGNGSGLAFCFEQYELQGELDAGQPFRLPLERLREAPGEAFGLGWVDQLAQELPEVESSDPPVSYMTGELYYTGQELPSSRHAVWRNNDARFLITEWHVIDWKQHCFQTAHLLVRVHLSTAQKERLFADDESELFQLMTRGDVIWQRWTVEPEAVRSGMDIYLILDLEEGRERGLVHEELLLG